MNSSAKILGSQTGFRMGYSEGYRIGFAESLLTKLDSLPEDPIFPLHVAYVQEGLFVLNDGIIDGLSRLVTRLTLINPDSEAVNRISDAKPDLVVVLNGIHAFRPEQVDAVRAMGIPIGVWFADDPYFTNVSTVYAPHYDYVFTHESSCVPLYESLGCRARYLPLAANRRTFRPLRVEDEYQSDICFIGTGFWNRIRFFNRLIPLVKHRRLLLFGGLWNRLKDYRRLASCIRLEGVGLEESVRYYNGAKIVINLHRDPFEPQHSKNSRRIPAESINPRTFEISACGALQLTDRRSDLTRFYKPGLELDTFATPEELVKKAEYYLRREDLRRTIALQGFQRTVQEHTFRQRLTELLLVMTGQT